MTTQAATATRTSSSRAPQTAPTMMVVLLQTCSAQTR
ncbi:hypothetical protein EYF80_063189 [Liparis tanakae]|uniref:Uncharacterized protein n=1 Tax=Liparis tanakae TaxID=230148 RepID=A0A4Z2ED65_9TELE|nr:hypothetical protein EYF80_063189 [Liparis tanakae]